MQIIKKITRIKEHSVVIEVPDEFKNKKVEIIVFPLNEKKRRFRSLELISMKTKDFSFNRDELHKR